MKTILAIFLAASLVAVPYIAAANAKSSPSGPPPIEQPLVREGDFAVELATALHLTSSHDEAAAEDYLVSIGISPRNGWISDYPMTPDIIAEIRDSASRSASSGNLKISETNAVSIVDKVSIAMNLPVQYAGEKYSYDSSSEYQSPAVRPLPEDSEYVEPYVVEDYYYDNEPPVVTYYPPPSEYAYLYDWVPDPFWWDGFGFGGFFILVDFDRHYHHHHITNHVTNADGRASRINATTRASASAMANTANTANTSASRNLTSSGAARDADRSIRDPGSATRDMDKFSSPSTHFSTGGYRSYGGGGYRSYGGGGGGGFHGGGGGFHGGGGGGHR
ncbi:MAG: hypothetical protein ACLQVJ_11655 [Syntrophobacteraceae bacterium]